MIYSYYVKSNLFSKNKTIKGINCSMSGAVFNPTFDGVRIIIPANIEVRIESAEKAIYIGKKKYFFNDDGNFTTNTGIVTHSDMMP